MQPYRKPGDLALYVHVHVIRPPSICPPHYTMQLLSPGEFQILHLTAMYLMKPLPLARLPKLRASGLL